MAFGLAFQGAGVAVVMCKRLATRQALRHAGGAVEICNGAMGKGGAKGDMGRCPIPREGRSLLFLGRHKQVPATRRRRRGR